VQAIGRQPDPSIRGPTAARSITSATARSRPRYTAAVQQHAATIFEQAAAAGGADLPQFVGDEFGAFLECSTLAYGFLRLRCGDCGHDKLVAFSCKRHGFSPSWEQDGAGWESGLSSILPLHVQANAHRVP